MRVCQNRENGVEGFVWEDKVLKRIVEDELQGTRELVVVPKKLKMRLMKFTHDKLGHVGSSKMIWALKQRCVWPGLDKLVKTYVKQCLQCQCMRKENVDKAPMGEMPIFSVPFQHVAIDIVGPFPRSQGYAYLLTYICLSSKYPEAIPMKTAVAQECAEALLEIFSRNGLPTTVLSDQGTQFIGYVMKRICERMDIQQIQTTPYHPQSNGTVERFHGTLVPMLRKLCLHDLPWPDQLKFALYAIRATPNRTIGFSPFEVVHGRKLSSPLDIVIDEIQPRTTRNVKAVEWLEELLRRVQVVRKQMKQNQKESQRKRKETYDTKSVMRSFKPGDMVLVRLPGMHGKLESAWGGPYKVLEVPSELHVVVGMADQTARKKGSKKRVHINTCKEFHQATINRVAVWAREDAEVDGLRNKLEGGEISKKHEDELKKYLSRWSEVLTDKPGKTDILRHDIVTGDAPPMRSVPYQVPMKWKDKFREEIESLVAQGILRPSTSPWSSPAVCVPKKNGMLRFKEAE